MGLYIEYIIQWVYLIVIYFPPLSLITLPPIFFILHAFISVIARCLRQQKDLQCPRYFTGGSCLTTPIHDELTTY